MSYRIAIVVSPILLMLAGMLGPSKVCADWPDEGPTDGRVLVAEMRHLRLGPQAEWAEFDRPPDAESLLVEFEAQRNAEPQTLSLRQQDVKQRWRVSLGEESLGRLVNSENDMRVYFEVPPGVLVDGTNRLTDWADIFTAIYRMPGVQLYVNGRLEHEQPVPPEAARRGGLKWQVTWPLPCPPHDVHLVAVVSGPGVEGLHWRSAKPYQPDSPQFEARSWGASRFKLRRPGDQRRPGPSRNQKINPTSGKQTRIKIHNSLPSPPVALCHV